MFPTLTTYISPSFLTANTVFLERSDTTDTLYPAGNGVTYDLFNASTPVPEPASIIHAGVAVCCLAWFRRRFKKE